MLTSDTASPLAATAPPGGTILDPARIRPVYQPIVDLDGGDVVGAEALARWPGSGVSPDVAFAWAREEGRVADLDALCQEAAVAGAAGRSLPPGFRLFVNVEPGGSVDALAAARGRVAVVAEITERALLADPARLLRSLRRLRAAGCAVALDDVGAVPDSLALLPFVAPDVVKLDISLVRAWPTRDQARILTAVAAYAEASGAVVLAEGVETVAHHRQALALGATLGQGWYYGRPGELTAPGAPRHPVLPLAVPAEPPGRRPSDLVGPSRLRVGPKGLLLGISHHLEHQGIALETPPVVLGAFQDRERFSPATARRYGALAARCPLVVALAAGMAERPAEAVRGAPLGAGDVLRGEWAVVVVGAHYAGALLARDLGDTGPDMERRYAFALTHDRATVLAAARLLLARVAPAGR